MLGLVHRLPILVNVLALASCMQSLNAPPIPVIACELKLTRNGEVPVILWPRDGMPVAHPGPIYRNAPPPDGGCYGKPEKTV